MKRVIIRCKSCYQSQQASQSAPYLRLGRQLKIIIEQRKRESQWGGCAYLKVTKGNEVGCERVKQERKDEIAGKENKVRKVQQTANVEAPQTKKDTIESIFLVVIRANRQVNQHHI